MLSTTVITIHVAFAASAFIVGPLALWARKGSRGHRAVGYAWVTLMLGAAISSLFMRDYDKPNLLGYTSIHLLTLATFSGVGRGLWLVAQGQIAQHRRIMQATYIGGCVLAGAFALMPHRLLGKLVWQQWLGLM